MTGSHLLPVVGLIVFSLIPSQLCKICEVDPKNYFSVEPLLNTMINSKSMSSLQPASVLLSLRLVGIQNQNITHKLIQRIRGYVERRGLNLSLGQLGLIILALGACYAPDKMFTYDHLFGPLENAYQAEIENMGKHSGNPLTNYYQLSLGVLALCLFNRRYSTTDVAELFAPDNENYYFGGHFSVDTGAMAVLALTCVKRTLIKGKTKSDQENLKSIDNHIESLVQKILSEKKENGLIGNTFSTGLALQALFVSSDYYKESEWNCQQTLDTILKEVSDGTFNIPISAAQILPPLLGKTYLDVNKDSPCVYDLGKFNISIQVPKPVTPPSSPSNIIVHYSVKINKTYSTSVTVPRGSVFLQVMEAAQKKNQTIFGFTKEQTSWGPYITSVQGLEANSNDRTYWELLSGGKSLDKGVGSYVVHEDEYLEVRWSKY